MPKLKISKSSVDAIESVSVEQTYWDDRLSGFGVKVTPAGNKVYVYRYRIAQPGRAAQTAPRKYTIGKHGELTPDQARKRAQELAALVASGVDPREQEIAILDAKREAQREKEEHARQETELAFDRVARRWLEHYEHEKEHRRSSVAMAELVVRRYLEPAFGAKPFPKIDHGDLQSLIDSIPTAKRAMRRNVFAYASVLFGWAARRRYISSNPLTLMDKPVAAASRDRVLSDAELRKVWLAARELAQPWSEFYHLLILTGQRKSEVAGMTWDELDRDNAVWVIPAERAKNKSPHMVPLSEPVIARLDLLAGGIGWPEQGPVLTTKGRVSISGFSKAKRTLDERLVKICDGKSIPEWRVHDLRRTVATGLQRLGVRFEVTEAVLNHVSGAKGGIAGVYQRHDWAEEKRTALRGWATHIERLLYGTETTNSPKDNQ
jgi:integrase